jgi:hypothetical protein
VDFLKQRLKFAIESLGQINPKTGTKFLQFDTWKMWIQNNSQATVEILDENFNDPLFTTYKFSDNFNEMEMIKVKELMEQEGHKTIAIPQWDKKAIATAVLGGQKIEGVKVTKGTHVRVQ